MNGGFSTYINNQVLQTYFGGSGISPPSTLYFGLSKNVFSNLSSMGNVVEPTDLYYTRVSVNNNAQNFNIPNNGMVSNKIALTWPTPQQDWGIVQCVFVADASGISKGNVIAYYNLTNQIAVNSGSVPLTIPSGSFNIIFS